VAGDAGVVVELLALADQFEILMLRSEDLRLSLEAAILRIKA